MERAHVGRSARRAGGLRAEVRGLEQDVRSIREDLDVLTMRVIRTDSAGHPDR